MISEWRIRISQQNFCQEIKTRLALDRTWSVTRGKGMAQGRVPANDVAAAESSPELPAKCTSLSRVWLESFTLTCATSPQ